MLTLPAGSTEISGSGRQLILRPAVTKTFIKGIIAIGVFSLFLNITSNLVHYLTFLGLSLGMLGLFMLFKNRATFKIGEENIEVKRLFGKPNSFGYEDIYDMSVAQGLLARRLNCGSVYIILKRGRGGVTLMGGGVAERLEDIPNPNYISDIISSRLGPYSAPSE